MASRRYQDSPKHEANRVYMRKWMADLKENNPAAYKRWRDKQEVARYKRMYGITPDEFAQMMCDQAGCCGVCDEPMTKPHVDHCHETGKVRGFLCPGCNTLVGVLENRKGLLAKAKAWIK